MDELLEKFIFHVGGDPCIILAHELEKLGDKEITDQELAEMLGQDLNATRKNLYKLMDYDLVIYRRTRDKKNGWIIFFFKQNFDGYQNVLVERNSIQIKKWKELLDFENDNIFYGCIAGCSRESFDKAMEMDFRCPSCDEIMNMLDNSQRINDLTMKIEAAERENGEILATKKKPVTKKKSKSRA
nr:hypothetical protein [Candidatus Sigynarchaeota archaeon]